ncbi:MAG: oligopeptide/dipeptide ABC transporter ATP-binding protein [Pseudorhodoplanes sp.]
MLERPDSPLLHVDGLTVLAPAGDKHRAILRDITLTLRRGEALGVIGESGSGKSTLAFAILNYLAPGLHVSEGQIDFDGHLLIGAKRSRAPLYGKRIAHVAQDPIAALNPVLKIGRQMTEGMRKHLRLSAAEADRRAVKLLEEVHLVGGPDLLERYPHELSGGMQQRVCIAMALACDPDLLILDEPTTGLDARTESVILDILAELKRSRNLSILLISHNIAAISDIADRVAVLYGGALMECGPIRDVLRDPRHRYTKLLLNAVPSIVSDDKPLADIPWQEAVLPESGCPFRSRCDLAVSDCAKPLEYRDVGSHWISACVRWQDAAQDVSQGDAVLAPRRADGTREPDVLAVERLSFSYPRRTTAEPLPKTLSEVNLTLGRGEVVALIGESGSGKSTLARLLVGLLHPESGLIRFRGSDLAALKRFPLQVTRYIQIVFQNIAGSLHPRKRLVDIVGRPFVLYENRKPSIQELTELLEPLGLRRQLLPRRPGALSGGERQRSALARANAPRPDVIILDEALSALDVSMKVRVTKVLLERCRSLGTSLLFVTHDLPFMRYVADRAAVLYRGWVCESGPVRAVLAPPHHPYTEALVWAARRLEGLKPARLDIARTTETLKRSFSTIGCPYQNECQRKLGSICETTTPPERKPADNHTIACHIELPELRKVQELEYRGDARASAAS